MNQILVSYRVTCLRPHLHVQETLCVIVYVTKVKCDDIFGTMWRTGDDTPTSNRPPVHRAGPHLVQLGKEDTKLLESRESPHDMYVPCHLFNYQRSQISKIFLSPTICHVSSSITLLHRLSNFIHSRPTLRDPPVQPITFYLTCQIVIGYVLNADSVAIHHLLSLYFSCHPYAQAWMLSYTRFEMASKEKE